MDGRFRVDIRKKIFIRVEIHWLHGEMVYAPFLETFKATLDPHPGVAEDFAAHRKEGWTG